MKCRSRSMAPALESVARLRDTCTAPFPGLMRGPPFAADREESAPSHLCLQPLPPRVHGDVLPIVRWPISTRDHPRGEPDASYVRRPSAPSSSRRTGVVARRCSACPCRGCSCVLASASALTMWTPVLNADAIQNTSPGRSKIFRTCSRPSAFVRKNFTFPNSSIKRSRQLSPSVKTSWPSEKNRGREWAAIFLGVAGSRPANWGDAAMSENVELLRSIRVRAVHTGKLYHFPMRRACQKRPMSASGS